MDVDDLLREFDDIPSKAASRQPIAPARASAAPAKPQPAPSTSQAAAAPSSQQQPPPSSHPRRASASNASASPAQSRMSSMMDDLGLHDLSPSDPGITPRRSAAGSNLQPAADAGNGTARSGAGPKTKCAMLYLGGTRFARGRNGGSGEPVCCDTLRCTKCDFKVVMTRDRQWAADADYLFFRNNYPDEAKLAPMHRRAPGSCAYCCQCSWVAAANETRVDFGGELRWVCAGHS